MIECCSYIFPIPLNPLKGLDRRLIVVFRLTKWMIGMFGIQGTGLSDLSLVRVLACHSVSTYSRLVCPLPTNNMRDCQRLPLPLVTMSDMETSANQLGPIPNMCQWTGSHHSQLAI